MEKVSLGTLDSGSYFSFSEDGDVYHLFIRSGNRVTIDQVGKEKTNTIVYEDVNTIMVFPVKCRVTYTLASGREESYNLDDYYK